MCVEVREAWSLFGCWFGCPGACTDFWVCFLCCVAIAGRGCVCVLACVTNCVGVFSCMCVSM